MLKINTITEKLNAVKSRQGCERLGSFSRQSLWREKSRSRASSQWLDEPACGKLTHFLAQMSTGHLPSPKIKFNSNNYTFTLNLKTKIKGNTMMEVLIALVIMSFSIALATNIYMNIQKSNKSFFKLKVIELSETALQKYSQHITANEETFKVEEFTIKKIVSSHQLLNDCLVLRVIVFDNQLKKIHEQETVVHQILND